MLFAGLTISFALCSGTCPHTHPLSRDLHTQCDDFADAGNCENQPGLMALYCPVACNACHLRDPAERCRKEHIHTQHDRVHELDDNNLEYMHYNRSAPIYAPGDLNRMFESIGRRFEKRYSISYLSRSPYIVTIDNFLNDQEVREWFMCMHCSVCLSVCVYVCMYAYACVYLCLCALNSMWCLECTKYTNQLCFVPAPAPAPAPAFLSAGPRSDQKRGKLGALHRLRPSIRPRRRGKKAERRQNQQQCLVRWRVRAPPGRGKYLQ